MQGNIEENLEPNLDQVIDNIQVEPILCTEPIVCITKLAIATTKSFQYVPPIVEHVQIKNP
jgi:hypothetical protein